MEREKSNDDQRVSSALAQKICSAASTERVAIVRSMMGEVFSGNETIGREAFSELVSVFGTTLYPAQYMSEEEAVTRLRCLPEAMEYFSEETLHTWMHTTKHEEVSIEQQVGMNMRQVIGLIGDSPDIPGFLKNDFGIRVIGRFSDPLLWRMHHFKDDWDKPYGVVLTTRRDYNGAFTDQRTRDIFNKLVLDMHMEKIRLRAIEVGSVREIEQVCQGYADNRPKPDFGIILVHANQKYLDFRNDQGEPISINAPEPVQSIARMIKPGGDLIFVACKAGRKNSFAEIAAREGVNAYGSSAATHIRKLHLSRDNGIHITPEYDIKRALRNYKPASQNSVTITS